MIFGDQMQRYSRDWRTINQRLVNRGKVITVLIEPSLIKENPVQNLNKNRVGRPFMFPAGLISAAFAIKCILRFGYREAEGFIGDISSKLKIKVPNFRAIRWRIDRMKNEGVKFNINEKHTVIAIDASGLRPVNYGEYRMMKYGKWREWIKIHTAIDPKSKEYLNVVVTKGNVGDCREFRNVVAPISNNVTEILADGGYCTKEIYEFCYDSNISPTIPVKINFSNKFIKSKIRRRMLEEQLGLICAPGYSGRNRFLTKEKRKQNLDQWKKKVGYGRRVLAASSFSRYKRVVGETLFSRKMENIEKEIVAKMNLLNKFTVMN